MEGKGDYKDSFKENMSINDHPCLLKWCVLAQAAGFDGKVLVSCDPESRSAQAERNSSEEEKSAAEAPEVEVVHFSDHIILFRPDVRAGG